MPIPKNFIPKNRPTNGRWAVLIIAAFLFLLHFLFLPSPALSQESGINHSVPLVTDFPVPKRLKLCNEPMPLEDRWVWEMLDRELTIAAWDRAQVFMWLKRAGRYFPYLEKRLREEGMPGDLKYLAVAESSLLTHIRSSKGAIGPWQFMPRTARRHGLRKDRRMDERRDFERATDAALRYLKKLKKTFGSWTMAMAAYNCGEARMKQEIRAQKEKSYYQLNLPNETERFIYRIAAIKLIMENPETYGYRVPKEKIYRPVQYDSVRIRVRVPIHLADFAKALGTNLKAIKDLNPQILGYHLPTGTYTLKTPPGTGRQVKQVLVRLARQTPSPGKVSGKYYIVRNGDTLSRISRKTGVPVSALQALNGIDGSLIRVGQRLRISH
ncbi:MAG: transglycosylase SLT domain-containing protein [Deltaproteobacteria bacterium]|nr:transglycosylase SLT domain-containing protein [Deltaproteobacteria bacterium]MBW2016041.1 transglycosylase SLT domain-containing protein [Deltaproteobacteria bacterium]MBW2128338.1 transglycosylase SLT domain-containing protein [Deltaproteobacteria bacterium]